MSLSTPEGRAHIRNEVTREVNSLGLLVCIQHVFDELEEYHKLLAQASRVEEVIETKHVLTYSEPPMDRFVGGDVSDGRTWPVSIDNKQLLTFTSKEKAEEFAATRDLPMIYVELETVIRVKKEFLDATETNRG